MNISAYSTFVKCQQPMVRSITGSNENNIVSTDSNGFSVLQVFYNDGYIIKVIT